MSNYVRYYFYMISRRLFTMKEVIHTSNAPAAIGPYSQAIKAGGAIYVSGQILLQALSQAIQSRNRHVSL